MAKCSSKLILTYASSHTDLLFSHPSPNVKKLVNHVVWAENCAVFRFSLKLWEWEVVQISLKLLSQTRWNQESERWNVEQNEICKCCWTSSTALGTLHLPPNELTSPRERKWFPVLFNTLLSEEQDKQRKASLNPDHRQKQWADRNAVRQLAELKADHHLWASSFVFYPCVTDSLTASLNTVRMSNTLEITQQVWGGTLILYLTEVIFSCPNTVSRGFQLIFTSSC